MSPRRVDLDELGVDEVLRRGISAARVGETGEARDCLSEVVRRDPGNADAWLWLGSLETNPQVKRDHFERVLALRPGDPDATAGIDRLVEKYGAGMVHHAQEDETLHCTWHPARETLLRCARCGRPMCTDCSRKHPVGWRCKECARETRSPLYKVAPRQYAGGFVAGLAASLGAAVLLGILGSFWFVGFLLAPAAGSFVADVTNRGAGRKRGRGLQVVAAAVVLIGALVVFLLVGLGPLGGVVPYSPLGGLLYVLLGGGAAFYRLR